MEFQSLLSALPDAVTSPYALIAYVLLVVANTVIAWKVKRNKNLLASIEKFPPEQRRDILVTEMGEPLPPNISAEQWLKHRTRQYYFLGFITVLVCGTVIFAIAYLNPKPVQVSWDSPSSLSSLKVGTTKAYMYTTLGIPPFSEDISEMLQAAEEVTYERYSADHKELQVLYIKNRLAGYAIRVFDKERITIPMRNGNPDWVLGKSTLPEAGDDPQLSIPELHWGKSICQIEQYYYGGYGEYNNYYYVMDKVSEKNDVPNAIMIAQDICSFFSNEENEDNEERTEECNNALLAMACTYADDFER